MPKLQSLPLFRISLQGYHQSRYAADIRQYRRLDGANTTLKLSIIEKLAPDRYTKVMHDRKIQDVDVCEFLFLLQTGELLAYIFDYFGLDVWVSSAPIDNL
jgi:hypothetical protein